MNTFSSLKDLGPRQFARSVCARGAGLMLIVAVTTLAACGGGGGSASSNGTSSNASSAGSGSGSSSGAQALAAAGGQTMSCGTPSTPTSAPSGSDLIEADTPGSDGTRMFAAGSTFNIALTTRATQNDTVSWKVLDNWNTVRASGQFPVTSGAKTTTLSCKSTLAGYFSIAATLATEGGQLMSRGTRPNGIATFGVLPDVSAVLPAVSYARQDLHRFGGQGAAYLIAGQTCCSGDGYRPLYTDLGLSWVNDNRNWYAEEPNGPNTFVPGLDTLVPFLKQGDLTRLIQLDGIPGWASPTGAATHSYAPTSETAYQDYMSRVGTDSNLIRSTYFPNQSNNYYQVTWE